ncbi:hypothetical protein [Aureivirga sp. CE67]|uniref:hypothetical protein n=1 Tax=Aureivirga sp. CE67 TaxID=1788983 RepID=UPI0018C90718|nr:hypothetical protein [Aureivirga sp. CE67]
MKNSYKIIIFFLLGIFSILNAMEVLSLRFHFVFLGLKIFWVCWVFYIIYKLKINDFIKACFTLIFMIASFFILNIHNYFKFFPTFGDYTFGAAFYQNCEASYNSQDRIEVYYKDYGLNDSSTKFVSVKSYFYFFETREEIYRISPPDSPCQTWIDEDYYKVFP